MTDTPPVSDLEKRLLDSDAASALTNEAAREIARLRAENERLRATVETLRGENAHLKGFAIWVWQESADSYELDTSDVQTNAQKHGLVDEVPYDPAIHGECEYDTPVGDPWLTLAAWVNKAAEGRE